MKTRTLRGGALAAAVLASALIAAPAQAAPVATETEAASCEVTGGTLSWGLKESFRSYISGTIANGEWEASDGAEYETPEFTWTGGAGEIDPATGTGEVSFEGTVHFAGHDGALDLVISNPTIEFEEGGKAAVMLDTRSTDVEGEVTVDEEQVWFGDIEVSQTLTPANDKLELVDLPATLTNSGASAFAGFYDAGVDLDPITISLDVASCDAAPIAAAPTEQPTVAPEEDAPSAVEPEAGAAVPWMPIIIGGVALVVIGVTAGMLIGGRQRKQAPGQGSDSGDPQ